MQLSNDVKKSVQYKQYSCHSNDLKYVSECQSGLTFVLIVQGQNNIEDRFDNRIFDKDFYVLWWAFDSKS